MTWLERAIGYVAPGWAAQRAVARAALVQAERLVGYRDAIATRLDPTVTVRGTSADYELELGYDRRKLVDRARELERSNLLAGALLDRSVEAVVGDGFTLRAQTSDPDWNARVEALWRDWSEDEAAVDARGISTFPELLMLLYRSRIRDGDAALLLLGDGTLRIVESDEISAPSGGYTRTDHVDGVDLDSRGRPVRFYVYDSRSKVLWADRRFSPARLAIPAAQIAFLARRTRYSQTRGLTSFLGAFVALEQLDGTIEAVTVAHRMAAAFGLVIKRNGPMLGLRAATDSSGQASRQLHIEPGAIARLDTNEEIQQVQAEHPTTNTFEHIRVLIRLVGTRFGIPLEVILGDYSQSNFSNTKAAMNAARRTWSREQDKLGRAGSKVYRWRVLNWIEQGLLPAREDAFAHRWLKPGWPWIDPVAEIQAAQAGIDCGLDTRADACARLGIDFERHVVPQLAHEREVLERAGIAIVRSTLTRDVGATAPASAPPPAPDEADDQVDEPDEDAAGE